MKFLRALFISTTLLFGASANAAIITFDVDFLDDNSVLFGSGQISFEEIPENTFVSFDDLVSLYWEFNFFGLSSPLTLGSSLGHIAGLDAGSGEGIIYDSSAIGNPLVFIDDNGSSIGFGAFNNLPSIRFTANSDEILWVRESWSENLATGTFVINQGTGAPIIGVANPSVVLMFALALLGTLVTRRRSLTAKR